MAADKRQYLLAIDNGTQSVRALVFDQDGQLVAKSKVDIEPYVSPKPGWAEQEPEYFWASLCKACQELWPKLDFPREDIKAVSVTTQRGTVVPVGVDGQPVCPAISWLDQRRVDTKPTLGWLNSIVISLLRARGAVDDFYSQAEANWLAQQQPEIWQRDILQKVFSYLAKESALVTYCAQGQVKRDLKASGFTVETLQGPPGKKEMTRGLKD